MIKCPGASEEDAICGTFMYCRINRVYQTGLLVLKTNDNRESKLQIELTLFKFHFRNSWIFVCYVQSNECKDIKNFNNYVKSF